MVRELRCLCKLIHCEGIYTMNYIMTYRFLFFRMYDFGKNSQIPQISLVALKWNELTLNLVRDFFLSEPPSSTIDEFT